MRILRTLLLDLKLGYPFQCRFQGRCLVLDQECMNYGFEIGLEFIALFTLFRLAKSFTYFVHLKKQHRRQSKGI